MYYIAEINHKFDSYRFEIIEFSDNQNYLVEKCKILNEKIKEELKLYNQAKEYCNSKDKNLEEDAPFKKYVFVRDNYYWVFESDRPDFYYEVRKIKDIGC